MTEYSNSPIQLSAFLGKIFNEIDQQIKQKTPKLTIEPDLIVNGNLRGGLDLAYEIFQLLTFKYKRKVLAQFLHKIQ